MSRNDTHTAPAGGLTREGMISMLETTTAREECLLFVTTYSTPNTRRAVDLAQAGRITWEQVRDLFRKALLAGIEAVA